MRAALLLLLALASGCGDDDEALPAAAEPALSATRYEHCLPSALEGATVVDAPVLSSTSEARDEIAATYGEGEGVFRVLAVLYRDPTAIEEERAAEAALLQACDQRPDCEPHTIGGASGRVVSFGPIGQESTNFFVDPGVRISVVGSPGRSAAFAELIDVDCLRSLHAEGSAP